MSRAHVTGVGVLGVWGYHHFVHPLPAAKGG